MKKHPIFILPAVWLAVAAVLCLTLASCSGDKTYVDMTRLTPQNVQVGWGKLGVNKSLDGGTIDMANQDGDTTTFARGFDAHAYSSLDFDVSSLPEAVVFNACIGAEHYRDDVATTATSVKFIVKADETVIFESGVMGYNDPYEEIFVPVPSGTKTLTLITDDLGDNNEDHAAWGSPRLLKDASVLENFGRIVLTSEKIVYLTGSELRLDAAFYNVGGSSFTPERVSFESSDPSVATVSQAGLVHALKEGAAIFTVTATHGDVTLQKSVSLIFVDRADPMSLRLASPSGNLTLDLTLDDQGMLSYEVSDSDAVRVLEKSSLGLAVEQCDFSYALTFVQQLGPNPVNETYHNISGKRSTVTNRYDETVLTFEKEDYFFDVYIRMYDDGFAWRFAVRRADGEAEELTGVSETGTFAIPGRSYIFAQYAQSLFSPYSYESGYRAAVTDEVPETSHPCFPATFSLYNDGRETGKYLLLSEADCFGDRYGGSVMTSRGDGVFGMTFAPNLYNVDDVTITTDFLSPWRYGIYGTLSDIVESDMTENLAPAASGDFSWVQPGVTAWMWLSEGFDGQRSEATIRDYIDLAAEMGWKYLILDEGWQPESADPAKKYDGYFDWFDGLLEYAESKGVGFIAWVKYCDLDTPEEREILAEWAEKGIRGIKADFFDSEDPDTLAGFRAIYEKCAENRLVVNCHGAGKPTGERRTWPNVINREAVNGEEYGGLWLNEAMYWVYARGVVGPIDITPRLLSSESANNTTAAQMAVNVIFESGVPCMASDSEEYRSFSCSDFYRDLPAAWDDVRFIDGSVGEWASIARRSGDTWYAAAMSKNARKNVVMPLDFLGEGTYIATVYAERGREDVKTIVREVTAEDHLKYSVMENGGCVIRFEKSGAGN